MLDYCVRKKGMPKSEKERKTGISTFLFMRVHFFLPNLLDFVDSFLVECFNEKLLKNFGSCKYILEQETGFL